MTSSDKSKLATQHGVFCQEAADRYLDERNAVEDAADWKYARWEARKMVIAAIRASRGLSDISEALQASGRHMIAFRHLTAPPISQDQFRLLCKQWPKGTEKSGKPIKAVTALAVASVFEERRDRRLSPWLELHRGPKFRELASTLGSIAPLIASQRIQTSRRNRLAARQEDAVIALLEKRGWTKQASRLITAGGSLPARHFMHKAKFASGKREIQEIDVACGLGGTNVLAIECKVTNDATNSIKRMNDVLKKATAWRNHWGSFVKPAAILEGNIKVSDVERLLDAGIEVFWSHRLDLFGNWLDSNVAATGS